MFPKNLPHVFVCVGHLVEGHAVILDGLSVTLLLKVDVSHVDFESAGVTEHLILNDDLIRVEGLRVHLVGRVLVRQVEENLK